MPCKQCGLSEASDAATSCDAVLYFHFGHQRKLSLLNKATTALCEVIKWFESNSIPQFFCTGKSHDTVASERPANAERRCLYQQWNDVPGGGLHRRLQLLLPASLVPGVLSGLHNSPVGGHAPRVKRTLEKVSMHFYWPGQKKKWCVSCAKCSSRKYPHSSRHHCSWSTLF